MKKILLLCVLTALAVSVRAEDQPQFQSGMAPRTDELFAPLLGDPRELHFALRMAYPQKEVTAAEVAVGHYYGIYRWALPNGIGAMQLDIGGGIFARFNFSYNKDLQVVDFYGNVPLDVRIGKWSSRFMFYHCSSHLGDDYIRETGQFGNNVSWNSLRLLLSYDFIPALRLYSGYTYNLAVTPPDQKTRAYQSGVEITPRIFNNPNSRAYWANDVQWWERTTYIPQFNSQIGIKMGVNPIFGRGITYFLEYTTGPEYYGQFFQIKETRITLGARFDID